VMTAVVYVLRSPGVWDLWNSQVTLGLLRDSHCSCLSPKEPLLVPWWIHHPRPWLLEALIIPWRLFLSQRHLSNPSLACDTIQCLWILILESSDLGSNLSSTTYWVVLFTPPSLSVSICVMGTERPILQHQEDNLITKQLRS
jgi:hypothetical protein